MALYEGDCFEVLPQRIPDESVDLIYVDPPFYTDRNFDAFDDRFESMDVYIGWLKFRIRECYDALKPTGSIYVHCDWHAARYIGVMMDGIFGYDNFQNEIIWHYRRWTVKANRFQKMHNTIWYYTKSDEYIFNQQYEPFGENTNIVPHENNVVAGKVVQNKKKLKSRDVRNGIAMHDVWDISFVHPETGERTGYPTQKPEALLERIILASSNEGDMVLDPMCGSGTACAVANRLHREFIGVDINPDAIELTRKRTHTQQQKLIP